MFFARIAILKSIIFFGVMSIQSQALSETLVSSTTQNGLRGVLESEVTSSCYDDFGVPHYGDIPDPTNCNYYFQCAPFGPNGEPIAIRSPCAGVEVGWDVGFSLNSCRCEFPYEPNYECFNEESQDHQRHRFKCAYPANRLPLNPIVDLKAGRRRLW